MYIKFTILDLFFFIIIEYLSFIDWSFNKHSINNNNNTVFIFIEYNFDTISKNNEIHDSIT